MHERPPLAAMEPTMRSRYFSKSSPALLAEDDLAVAGAVQLDAGVVLAHFGGGGVAEEHRAVDVAEELARAAVVGRVEAERLGRHAGGDEGLDDAAAASRALRGRA